MIDFAPTAILRNGLRLLVPLSLSLTVYLYLYPVFNTCAFALPPVNGTGAAHGPDTGLVAFRETAKAHLARFSSPALAPFRLLALGDPQLEGDTSIPNAHSPSFPHLTSLVRHLTFASDVSSIRHRLRQTLHDLVDFYLDDIPNTIESARKRIDLLGNDYYLAHIYRTLHWWTRPTHVAVLGDLLGSQWIEDREFEERAHRFWTRVFRHGLRVPDEMALAPAEEHDLAGYLGGPESNATAVWARRVINVAGNHDIGYAGDINADRVARFERAFGKLNYELRFELALANATLAATTHDAATNPDSDRLMPELRLVVVNDMNLDTPAASTELQDETYAFVNGVINTATAVEYRGHFTLVLTHVPLHKPAGVCPDAPFFDFHEDGTLKEQNLLSDAASSGFLEGIFGMSGDAAAPGRGRGRPGLVLDGHDHEGCDTFHFVNQSRDPAAGDRAWEACRWREAPARGLLGQPHLPGVREITVRSMMGEFGGSAGLLSLWFDPESWEWRYEYVTCPLGTQHLWWIVHILDLVTAVAVLLYVEVLSLSAVGVDVDAMFVGQAEGPAKVHVHGGTNGDITSAGNGHAKKAAGPNGNGDIGALGNGTARQD
ncbi:hypothetical protein P8C59_005981 [Phyllachora maydis]|uniref:Uncharacterized protein n=1 Tax=Phyllachora maydis TaxID=1825666 RepID=A0AAD9I5E8_9PEZI|nr:hypothetical protein P8C59_005981 [Phyllachora maydis]